MAAVLSAIESTVKGGIGKLRERPQGTKYQPGERWPARNGRRGGRMSGPR